MLCFSNLIFEWSAPGNAAGSIVLYGKIKNPPALEAGGVLEKTNVPDVTVNYLPAFLWVVNGCPNPGFTGIFMNP
jgi:hypothetical protein